MQSLPNLHIPYPCAKQGLSLEEPLAPDLGGGAVARHLLETILDDLVSSRHAVCKVAVAAFLAIAEAVQDFAGDLGRVPWALALSFRGTFALGGVAVGGSR